MFMATSATFSTRLWAEGNNTAIEVPAAAIKTLGAGKRPGVIVKVNTYEYRSTVAVMGGKCLIPFAAAHRKASGIGAGDAIKVKLTLAQGPREVDMPADFRKALKQEPAAEAFFDGLSNSLQRYHTDLINGAKTEETRDRRIDKAIALFLAGKKR
jgi:hypothetical protein